VAEAYCVRDKMKVEMKNPVKVTMKNGKPAWKGTCPKCGNSVFRIGAYSAPTRKREARGPGAEPGPLVDSRPLSRLAPISDT